jgi:hypothetical protein
VTAKGNGTKDGEGIQIGQATEEGEGKGKGHTHGKGIVKQSPRGDDNSCTLAVQWQKENV